MTVTSDRVEMTSNESSLCVISATLFGFSPNREAWFRYREGVIAEQERSFPPDSRTGPDAPLGWWVGWLNIGEVTLDEAVSMADALDRASAWYALQPGAVPDWFDPYPQWDWQGIAKLLADRSLIETLPRIALFLRGGAFVGSVRHTPYAVVLLRKGGQQ